MKKYINILLVFAMIITVMPVKAKAADNKLYEEIIEDMGIIPEDFKSINSCVYENKCGNICFNNQWYHKSYSTQLYIEYTEGFITEYELFYKEEYIDSLKKVTLTEADLEKLSVQKFCKLNPKLKGSFKAEKAYDQDGVYTYLIYRYVNGIPLKDCTGRISLDLGTGEICRMSLESIVNADDSKFPVYEKQLSAVEAGLKLFESGDMKLVPFYRIDKEKGTAQPYYIFSENGRRRSVNAVSGREAKYPQSFYYDTTDYEGWLSMVTYFDDMSEDDEPVFTYHQSPLPYYLKTRKLKKRCITPEKLLEKVRTDKHIYIPKDVELKVSEQYTGICSLEYGVRQDAVFYKYTSGRGYELEVCADAYTGKIISFSNSRAYNEEDADDEKEVLAAADEAMKYYLGDTASEYRADTISSNTVIYIRYVNGIRVPDNYIIVQVSKDGHIYYFSNNTDMPYKGVRFSDKELVSHKTVLEAYFKEYPPRLEYLACTDENGRVRIQLVYTFDDEYEFCADALTGELL